MNIIILLTILLNKKSRIFIRFQNIEIRCLQLYRHLSTTILLHLSPHTFDYIAAIYKLQYLSASVPIYEIYNYVLISLSNILFNQLNDNRSFHNTSFNYKFNLHNT